MPQSSTNKDLRYEVISLSLGLLGCKPNENEARCLKVSAIHDKNEDDQLARSLAAAAILPRQ